MAEWLANASIESLTVQVPLPAARRMPTGGPITCVHSPTDDDDQDSGANCQDEADTLETLDLENMWSVVDLPSSPHSARSPLCEGPGSPYGDDVFYECEEVPQPKGAAGAVDVEAKGVQRVRKLSAVSIKIEAGSATPRFSALASPRGVRRRIKWFLMQHAMSSLDRTESLVDEIRQGRSTEEQVFARLRGEFLRPGAIHMHKDSLTNIHNDCDEDVYDADEDGSTEDALGSSTTSSAAESTRWGDSRAGMFSFARFRGDEVVEEEEEEETKSEQDQTEAEGLFWAERSSSTGGSARNLGLPRDGADPDGSNAVTRAVEQVVAELEALSVTTAGPDPPADHEHSIKTERAPTVRFCDTVFAIRTDMSGLPLGPETAPLKEPHLLTQPLVPQARAAWGQSGMRRRRKKKKRRVRRLTDADKMLLYTWREDLKSKKFADKEARLLIELQERERERVAAESAMLGPVQVLHQVIGDTKEESALVRKGAMPVLPYTRDKNGVLRLTTPKLAGKAQQLRPLGKNSGLHQFAGAPRYARELPKVTSEDLNQSVRDDLADALAFISQ